MKKRMLIAAAVAAMTVSGGAWAACTADIDMGGYKIRDLATPMADSDAATKAYVDAIGQLEVSPVTSVQVDSFLGAVQFCQDLNEAGDAVSDGSFPKNGWRLPQTLGEASLGFGAVTSTVNIHTLPQSYAASGGNAPVSGSYVWVAMPYSDGNRPPDGSTNDNLDDQRWMMARLDGVRWTYSRSNSSSVFAFCVR